MVPKTAGGHQKMYLRPALHCNTHVFEFDIYGRAGLTPRRHWTRSASLARVCTWGSPCETCAGAYVRRTTGAMVGSRPGMSCNRTILGEDSRSASCIIASRT